MIEVSLKFERGGRSDVFQSISIMFLVAGGVKVAPIPKGKSGSWLVDLAIASKMPREYDFRSEATRNSLMF